MKKLLALVLALAMMLCMGTALAASDTFKLDKTWTINSSVANATYDEDLEFVILAKKVTNSDAASAPNITLTKAKGQTAFALSGTFEKVGNYFYLVQEKKNLTAGVTYDETYYVVEVVVTYALDENGVPKADLEYQYEVSVAAEGSVVDGKPVEATEDAEGWAGTASKIKDITNTFDDGTLSIDKIVTGTLAEQDDEFEVEVTFTSAKEVKTTIYLNGEDAGLAWAKSGDVWTATDEITVTGDGTYKYTGIPVEVNVAVEETDTGVYKLEGYTFEGKETKAPAGEVTKDNKDLDVTITNSYNANVNTGINMDSMPYIVLMGLVVLAGVALILKKRTVND